MTNILINKTAFKPETRFEGSSKIQIENLNS